MHGMILEFREDRVTCLKCDSTFSCDYIRKQKHKCNTTKKIVSSSVEVTDTALNADKSSLRAAYKKRLLEKILEVKEKVKVQAA